MTEEELVWSRKTPTAIGINRDEAFEVFLALEIQYLALPVVDADSLAISFN
jgi:hypothetical protein